MPKVSGGRTEKIKIKSDIRNDGQSAWEDKAINLIQQL